MQNTKSKPFTKYRNHARTIITRHTQNTDNHAKNKTQNIQTKENTFSTKASKPHPKQNRTQNTESHATHRTKPYKRIQKTMHT